jgi:hypothetical protein
MLFPPLTMLKVVTGEGKEKATEKRKEKGVSEAHQIEPQGGIEVGKEAQQGMVEGEGMVAPGEAAEGAAGGGSKGLEPVRVVAVPVFV